MRVQRDSLLSAFEHFHNFNHADFKHADAGEDAVGVPVNGLNPPHNSLAWWRSSSERGLFQTSSPNQNLAGFLLFSAHVSGP